MEANVSFRLASAISRHISLKLSWSNILPLSSTLDPALSCECGYFDKSRPNQVYIRSEPAQF